MVRLRGGQGKGGICIYWEYVPEKGIFGLFEEKKETEKEKKENLLKTRCQTYSNGSPKVSRFS